MSEFLSGLASGSASGLLKLATGSAGSLLDTAINGSWRTRARFQRDMQKQLMSYQAELNREQYDYEMSQESPAAQRQRLEAAGFNPALVMGGAGGSSGISASVGSVSGGSSGLPSVPSVSLPNLSMTDMAQIGALNAQKDLSESQARKNNAEAENLERQNNNGMPEVQVEIAKSIKELNDSLAYSEEAKGRLNATLADTERMLQSVKLMTSRAQYRQINALTSETLANVRWLDQQTDRSKQLTPLDKHNTWLTGLKIGAEIALVQAQEYLTGKQAYESTQKGHYYHYASIGMSIEAGLKQSANIMGLDWQEYENRVLTSGYLLREAAARAGMVEWQKDHMWLGSVMTGAMGLVQLATPFAVGLSKKLFKKLGDDLNVPGRFVQKLSEQIGSLEGSWTTSSPQTLPQFEAPLWE